LTISLLDKRTSRVWKTYRTRASAADSLNIEVPVLSTTVTRRSPSRAATAPNVASLRGLPYTLDAHGVPEQPDQDRRALAERLRTCRNPVEDSPLFQLVTDWPRPDIARLKTDKFREAVEYSRRYKDQLAAARRAGPDAVRAIERELNVKDADPAIVVDLFLSYRAVKDWESMSSSSAAWRRSSPEPSWCASSWASRSID